nr:putative 2-aminoethylphosphonate ABC transporter permease subunit [uncultured Rhodopila sp.]
MSDLTVSGPAELPAGGLVVPKLSADERVMRGGMWVATVALAAALVLPLGFLLWRSFQDRDGNFVGLDNFAAYVTTPALLSSVWNSVWTASVTALVVVPLAFGYAYALTRSCIPARPLFRSIALLPVLAPSLLPALALIYLCGNQGILTPLFGRSIYGPVGIVVAQIFYTFPHAMLILTVALSTADARLYEAAEVLGASRGRIMHTVTLPGARFGLVSAAVVVFTLVITDFGIPKVIGGDFNVLATDVYKQVVGLQNFNMGAVVGMVLLLPAIGAFLLETWARRQQSGSLSGRAVPYVPRPRAMRDRIALGLVLVVSFLLILIVGIAIWGSLIRFWPYNLTLTLRNYEFSRFDFAGWGSLLVSLQMAGMAALIGTVMVFIVAYLMERGPKGWWLTPVLRFVVGLPLAVPGLVLGLAYILFFNEPWNPLGFIYGTLAILVLNSIVHFYTVCHLTATTAIRQLDPEFEAASASLKVPVWRTFLSVTVPMCLPAILDIAVYVFVNAMTTVSAVIFLYGPDTKPASVAVVSMDEAGQASAAAAMAVMILCVTSSAKLVQVAAGGLVDRTTQAWRRR